MDYSIDNRGKVWIKISGNNEFRTYYVNNLIKFVEFADWKFPKWKWFNVYDFDGNCIDRYTYKERPKYKWR